MGSIPTRESVITFTWHAAGHRLDDSQLTDITNTLSLLMNQAIVLEEGVQMPLRMVE